MKNDFFKLKDHGTTVRREVLAGITTFMTMAYVLAVQPSAVCGFGPFVMILFGTFTGDIAAAICLGVLTDVLIKVLTGDAKKVHPVLYVLCIPLVLYFIV